MSETSMADRQSGPVHEVSTACFSSTPISFFTCCVKNSQAPGSFRVIPRAGLLYVFSSRIRPFLSGADLSFWAADASVRNKTAKTVKRRSINGFSIQDLPVDFHV